MSIFFKRKSHLDRACIRLIAFALLTLALVFIAIFCDYLTPYDPYAQNLELAKQAPSAAHLLGTDRYGRDVFSRVIAGSRISIFSSLALVAIIAAIGTAVGLVCAMAGGIIDGIFMAVADMFLAFPGLVLALAVAAILGGGLTGAIIALALISWPKYARLVRSQALTIKNATWVKALIMSGCNNRQLICRHILPNILPTVIVTAVLDIGTMLMELAALSFLGLGVQAPAAEWGSMISDTRSLMTISPWITFSPGVAIFITVIIFNLFGDALSDYFNPRRIGR